MKKISNSIDAFEFSPGTVFADKYEVVDLLGAGWEGEVYKVLELATGIERAVKLFFPKRDNKAKLIKWYAEKLHKLRSCPVVIHYHTLETITFREQTVSFLVSEYVEGVLLSDFLSRKRGQRLTVYEGLHLLYALAEGMESVHHLREYHGDLHTDNIILCRQGLKFDLKLIDFYHWGAPSKENIYEDICKLIRIFYDVLGGAKTYAKHPQVVKDICCGLKRSLILKKFKTAGQLRSYLERLEL